MTERELILINNLKHTLVSRQFNTAILRAVLLTDRFPGHPQVSAIEKQIRKLDEKIKNDPAYKHIFLEIQHLIQN